MAVSMTATTLAVFRHVNPKLFWHPVMTYTREPSGDAATPYADSKPRGILAIGDLQWMSTTVRKAWNWSLMDLLPEK